MSSLELSRRPAGDDGRTFRTARLTNGRRRNAIDLVTAIELRTALAESPEEVFVLGSSTPGVFCAGADLKVSATERTRVSDVLYECYQTMVTRPGTVIAVVDGPAVGGGAQLSTAADLRIAGPAARWRWVGPGHGLAVGAWILPELLGRGRGLELALTGRWLELDEAVTCGLAGRVAPDPWAEAMSLAAALTVVEASALARVKKGADHDGGILAALAHEREQNRLAWDGRARLPDSPAEAPGSRRKDA